ncbi:MAG: YbaN family protein [Planctomycetota bacterium]
MSVHSPVRPPKLAALPEASTPSGIRWAYAALGVACVALGGLGVVVPGLPTTVFLIIASWCFAKGCPWLEDRLLRNRFFAPYMRYVDGAEPMPMKARVISIAMVLVASGISMIWLGATDRPMWVIGLVAASALIGILFIARYRRA